MLGAKGVRTPAAGRYRIKRSGWRRIAAWAAALGVGIAAMQSNAMAGDIPGDVEELTAAYGGLGQDIFRQLATKPGNVVMSPYSIGMGLAMVLSAARGETKTGLPRVLRHTLAVSGVEQANETLLARLKSRQEEAGPESVRLMSANALMLTGDTEHISEAYRSLLANRFEAEIFSGAGVADINAWVARKTEGKIGKILDGLGANSAAVILNAVYFRGRWDVPFTPGSTKPMPFWIDGKTKADVATMHQSEPRPLVRRPGYRVIRLPYVDRSVGLLIVLPDEVGGLAAIERTLTAADVRGWSEDLDRADPAIVDLALPKFKAELGADLLAALEAMGLQRDGDYSGMTGAANSLGIGQIVHKAMIEVDEEGSEAAAATAVEMVGRSMLPPPKVERFAVDRPFLFFLVDDDAAGVLFMGRIVKPQS